MVLHLLVGVQPSDVLRRDLVGFEVGVHVLGENVTLIPVTENLVTFALPFDRLAESRDRTGIRDLLFVLDPGLPGVLDGRSLVGQRDVVHRPVSDSKVPFLGRLLVTNPFVCLVHQTHGQCSQPRIGVFSREISPCLLSQVTQLLTESLDANRLLLISLCDLSRTILVDSRGALAV